MIDFNKQILFAYSTEEGLVALKSHQQGEELASIEDVLKDDEYQQSQDMKPLGYFGIIITKEGIYSFENDKYVKL